MEGTIRYKTMNDGSIQIRTDEVVPANIAMAIIEALLIGFVKAEGVGGTAAILGGLLQKAKVNAEGTAGDNVGVIQA